MNFYNDIEPYAAEWLRNLIAAGHIGAGDVVETPIQDLEAWQLTGYERCHFFSGLGGWEYAFKLAGWPAGIPAWSGSCPCQPFSVAGKQKGNSDERHLWPPWFQLIRQCHPPIIFGEQVEGAIGHGWLDGVFGDLEAEGYTCGAAVLGAHSVGAPHIRQRLYWGAYDGEQFGAIRLAYSVSAGRPEWGSKSRNGSITGSGNTGRLANPISSNVVIREKTERQTEFTGGSVFSGLGDTDDERSQRRREHAGKYADKRSAWTPSEFIACHDGKTRRVEPGVFPLAHGVPARVGKLRAYGNAIVPQVAAEFISAVMDIINV